MKNRSIGIVCSLFLTAAGYTAQTNLLEHIPTTEFAVITFDGAALNAKSKDLNQLAIYDSLTTQFERLLSSYKQAIIDEKTSLTDEEVDELRESIENAADQVKEAYIDDNNYDEAIEVPEEYDQVEEVEGDYEYNYDYDYNNYYTPQPSLTLENIFTGLVGNGANYGVNNATTYYYIIGNNDSISHSALLFSKGDATKFDDFIAKIIPIEEKEQLITLKTGYQYYSDNEVIIAWNNNMVAFIDYSIPYDYNSYYYEEEDAVSEDYYETYEDQLAAEAKKQELEKSARIESVLNDIFNANPQLSLKFNTNYKKSLVEKGDVTYFINALGSNTDIFFNAYSNSNSKTEDFLSLFKDNFTYGSLNFNNSDVSLNVTQHVGAHYLKQVKEINNKKFNKSMYRYIDGENLLGIVGFATNMKPAYEIYKDMYINILTNMEYGENWIGTAADIAFTFFDENELFDLIKGDFVFAITDIKEVDVPYTSYDYDEDYNRIETIETTRETLPEFVSIATIGNEKLRAKIIKLMTQTDVIRKVGDYYELQEPKSRYSDEEAKPLNIFYMIKNDLLIVTNNEALLKDNNGNGLPKAKQIKGEPYSLMKSNNMFAYWTPKSTYDKIPAIYALELEPLASAADTFQSFVLKGVENKGNLFKTTAKVNLVENNKGSLMLSLEVINELIKAAGRF